MSLVKYTGGIRPGVDMRDPATGVAYYCPYNTTVSVPDTLEAVLLTRTDFVDGGDGSPGYTPPAATKNVGGLVKVPAGSGTDPLVWDATSGSGPRALGIDETGAPSLLTVGAGNALPSITDVGNLTATQNVALSTTQEKWVSGVLTANCVVTVTAFPAGSQGLLLFAQDATGGRTLSISDGTSTVQLTVDTTANKPVRAALRSPDGVKLQVEVIGPITGDKGDQGAKGDKGDTGNTGNTGPAGPGFPPFISIEGFSAAKAESGTNTFAQNSASYRGGQRAIGAGSPGEQGAWAEWDFAVAAGTYAVGVETLGATSAGKLVVSIDGVTIGTIDTYNATTAALAIARYTGVVLAQGTHTIRFTTDSTRNASSSSYQCRLSGATITRTGA